MPYKPKLKSPSTKSRSKPKYKVINWTEYNKSLKKRGELSFYFPKGDLKALFINETPYVPGLSGQQASKRPRNPMATPQSPANTRHCLF